MIQRWNKRGHPFLLAPLRWSLDITEAISHPPLKPLPFACRCYYFCLKSLSCTLCFQRCLISAVSWHHPHLQPGGSFWEVCIWVYLGQKCFSCHIKVQQVFSWDIAESHRCLFLNSVNQVPHDKSYWSQPPVPDWPFRFSQGLVFTPTNSQTQNQLM